MKNFRLLLAMSSLLALVCSFTACTDVDGGYPTVTVSVEAGTISDATATFTVKAQGADDVYYWVFPTPAEGEEGYELLIDNASYIDASVDSPLEQVVTVSGLKPTTEYDVHVFAKNFAHSAYANPIKVTTVATPLPIPAPVINEVVVEKAEITETSFLAFVTIEGASKAAYLVVPKYTPGVTAAKVFADGVAITENLNEEVTITVEGLNPGTDYEFYVAADNQGVLALSNPVAVSTLVPQTPVVEMHFDELTTNQDLAAAGLPGIYVSVRDSNTGAMASLFLLDYSAAEYAGYLAAGDYPVLSGNVEGGVLPEASCLLADPGFTSFADAEHEYFVVGDLPATDEGVVYGVNVMTSMPDSDDNRLTFNLAVKDENGNDYIIQGDYTGPLGYTAKIAAYPFNLDMFGFRTFNATVSGNVVTLKSTSMNGDFEMVLQTENGQWVDTAFVAGEGGNLTGGYTSYLEGTIETFTFTSGRISFSKAEGENAYTLNVSTRGADWIMQGQTGAYLIEAPEDGYAITVNVTEAPAALSIDGKRWQLPASFALATVGREAVCFVDLGVTAPGKFFIGADLESVYGPDAAGYAQNIMGSVFDFTVQTTDATSGNIVLAVTDLFGDTTNVPVPYSNLTAESVTIDLTNVLGNAGITTCECTLFTKNIVAVQ